MEKATLADEFLAQVRAIEEQCMRLAVARVAWDDPYLSRELFITQGDKDRLKAQMMAYEIKAFK